MQAISGPCRFLLVLLLGGGLAGCRTLLFKKAEADEAAAADSAAQQEPASMILPVGVVQLVDTAGGFVLIRSSRGLQIEPGTVLTLYGSGGAAEARVKVSPARKGSFLTADNVDGVPKTGQQATMEYRPATPRDQSGPAFSGQDDPNAIQVLE